ncbi:Starch-binding associating with outer membrane [Dyadobacter soli]|uniref:Starch-binding associating with outer membrane n=1 Tax=Dyadobacter soli TaxID=659014 RepID=A0A1G7VIK2_9BACT|nr:RagB/SusD family nutrient uptake outer membrane protein [Dyadobacter soli]SDG59229.1 Starch-binding associating with outer membrane [Dyadobacter soli]
MRKTLFRTVACLIGLLSATSCKNYLDKQPDDMLTIDKVFAVRTQTQAYLSSVYSFIPDVLSMQNNYNMLGICDEGDFIWAASWAGQINNGNWNPTSGYYDKWAAFYKGIRSASIFINRVDECQDPTLEPQVRASWKQEARALRAMYYFFLLRQYGPLVILPEETIDVNAPNEDLQLARKPFDECLDYIVGEFDAVIASPDLPDRFVNANDKGRIDKNTVMGFKSRALLMAASPLWNGNTDYGNFRNPDGTALVNPTYDAGKWDKAAQAAKALIDKYPSGLYKKTPDGQSQFDPYTSYRDVFLDRWNQEVIYARPQMASSAADVGWERHCAPRFVNGWNGVGISQQMVDAYFMSNGKKINEAGSQYVETGFSAATGKYTKANTANMYVNREPRFYASVIYNGADWIYKEDGKPNRTVELFFTGNCGKQGSHDHSATGYLCSKNISPNSNLQEWTGALRSLVLIRLAEIYLNYAEALNEARDDQASRAEAAIYIDKIRERAGIPALESDKKASQAAMRTAIRDERRVELAFEGFRAWDTRRWKIAEQVDGAPLMGMNVNAGKSLTDTEFYKRTVVEQRAFPRNYYLWPIPQYDIVRNKACIQNPGW